MLGFVDGVENQSLRSPSLRNLPKQQTSNHRQKISYFQWRKTWNSRAGNPAEEIQRNPLFVSHCWSISDQLFQEVGQTFPQQKDKQEQKAATQRFVQRRGFSYLRPAPGGGQLLRQNSSGSHELTRRHHQRVSRVFFVCVLKRKRKRKQWAKVPMLLFCFFSGWAPSNFFLLSAHQPLSFLVLNRHQVVLEDLVQASCPHIIRNSDRPPTIKKNGFSHNHKLKADKKRPWTGCLLRN